MTATPATIYDVYKTVFHLATDLHHKSMILTQLMTSERSWRVIGVTPTAKELLSEKPEKGKKAATVDESENKTTKVQRAHIVSRFSIAAQVFQRSRPMQPGEFELFFETFDRTVLVGPGEHAHNPQALPLVIPLILDDENILFSGKGIGYRCREMERNHLRELDASAPPKHPLELLKSSIPDLWRENLDAMVLHTQERRRGSRKA